MEKPLLFTLTEAAAMLGIRPGALGEVVRVMGITHKPMCNGRAKGLDEADIKVLRKALATRTQYSRTAQPSHPA
jgi:hypothetical protein